MFLRYTLSLLTNLVLVALAWAFPNSRSPRRALFFARRPHSQLAVSLDDSMRTMTDDIDREELLLPTRPLVIHWRGEKESGYSKPFRQLEFVSALEAELGLPYSHPIPLKFTNALNYTGQAEMADVNIEHFNEAMQYLNFVSNDPTTPISREAVIRAGERCSLVHAVYEVIASSEDIHELALLAIKDGGFEDMYKGEENQKMTWCFRARNYREPTTSDAGREKRYSSRARSMGLEKAGLTALKELLLKFGGKVDLLEPQCKIYLFDGLTANSKTLARRIATGPKVRAFICSLHISSLPLICLHIALRRHQSSLLPLEYA